MKMDVEIYITRIIVKARMVEGRTDNIIGFAELWFYGDLRELPILKLKGFAYKKKRFPKSNRETITVDFPVIPWKASKNGFLFSVFIENKELYDGIVKLLLSALNSEDSNLVDIDNYTDNDSANGEITNNDDEETDY